MEINETYTSSESSWPLFFKVLFAAIQAAPSADNSQPWRIDWSDSKLILRYDVERVTGVTFPFDNRATLLSAGGVIENIAQYCKQVGVNVGIIYLPDSTLYSQVVAEFTFDTTDACVDENFNLPLFLRHTNRFSYKKERVPPGVVDELMAMNIGPPNVSFLQNPATIHAIGRQVQDAGEIRFQTKEVHEWLEKSLRFTPEQIRSGDGLDIRTLDLPPGGGLLLRFISRWSRMKRLNRIGTHKMLAAIDAAPVKKAPGIVAITGRNTKLGAIEAGRLLCRAWIYLNDQGIACHPYYVISDQLDRLEQGSVPAELVPRAEKVRKECRQLFDLKPGDTLMMLLRVGYPERQPPRSQRLPLERVFTDLTGNLAGMD